MKHVLFSVQRIEVRTFSGGESSLYFAKSRGLRQQDAFALGESLQAPLQLLRRCDGQRARQMKRFVVQDGSLKVCLYHGQLEQRLAEGIEWGGQFKLIQGLIDCRAGL